VSHGFYGGASLAMTFWSSARVKCSWSIFWPCSDPVGQPFYGEFHTGLLLAWLSLGERYTSLGPSLTFELNLKWWLRSFGKQDVLWARIGCTPKWLSLLSKWGWLPLFPTQVDSPLLWWANWSWWSIRFNWPSPPLSGKSYAPWVFTFPWQRGWGVGLVSEPLFPLLLHC